VTLTASFQLVSLDVDLAAIAAMALPGGMVYDYFEGKASEVQSVAQFLAPVDTGALRESIFMRTFSDGEGNGFEIGTDVEYAIYQELGTVHHGPHAFLRPALEAVMGGFSGYGGE
jgi:HK97 gp10 family phage protein